MALSLSFSGGSMWRRPGLNYHLHSQPHGVLGGGYMRKTKLQSPPSSPNKAECLKGFQYFVRPERSTAFWGSVFMTNCMFYIHTCTTYHCGILLPSANVAFDKKYDGG